ncbi:MAG: hypothetical protein H7A33_07365 [Deltaproteobacteria bacterium]|nr:hypothetical protein [Deltaproteobacteria bacterium]
MGFDFSVPHYMQLDKTSFLIDLMEHQSHGAAELRWLWPNLIELYYNGGPDEPLTMLVSSQRVAVGQLITLLFDAKLNLQGFFF